MSVLKVKDGDGIWTSIPSIETFIDDGSLEEAKFSDDLKLKTIKDYVTPEMFGAKGDGVTDDTLALTQSIQNALQKNTFVFGTGTYKVNGLVISNNNTKLMLYKLISDGDALKVTSSFNQIFIDYIVSENGIGLLLENAKYSKFVSLVISGDSCAIKLISKNDSVMFNEVKATEVFGDVGVILSYTARIQDVEWVNGNFFDVWSFHTTTGISISSAAEDACNENVFNNPNFELCTTGIQITGKVQYLRFLGIRNEEVTPDKTILSLDGSFRNSLVDCKTPVYHSNFVCTGTSSIIAGAMSIIKGGVKDTYNTLIWIGDIGLTAANGNMRLFPLEKQPERAGYQNNQPLDPNTTSDMTKLTTIFSNGTRDLIVSDDYGYQRGELPLLVVAQNHSITLKREDETVIRTLTNTSGSPFYIPYKVHFLDETTTVATY